MARRKSTWLWGTAARIRLAQRVTRALQTVNLDTVRGERLFRAMVQHPVSGRVTVQKCEEGVVMIAAQAQRSKPAGGDAVR